MPISGRSTFLNQPLVPTPAWSTSGASRTQEHPLLTAARDPDSSLETIDRWFTHDPAAPTVQDNTGATVLMLLALHGNAAKVRRALDAGASTTVIDGHGRTPLMFAAQSGDPARIVLLLPGSDPAASTVQGSTALMMACCAPSRSACVDLLLPGSDVNAQDVNGVTALMTAASYGDAPMVKRLLPGSDAILTDQEGNTALLRAVQTGWVDKINLLLDVSDLRVRNQSGYSAMMIAAGRRDGPSVVQRLLRDLAPADPMLAADPTPPGAPAPLDVALQQRCWPNAQALALAMEPTLALNRLRTCSDPQGARLIEQVLAHERAQLRTILDNSVPAPSLPRARSRSRL